MHPPSLRTQLALVAAAILLLPATLPAADWTLTDGTVVPGELQRFDFTEKRAIFEKPDGGSRAVPTEELSPASRWRLLLSPAYNRGFPEEQWTPEQGRYYACLLAVPIACLLLSFYICAIVLFKQGNPLKALAGWFGSALLGGFLMSFYLYLSHRNATSATAILVGGAVVCAVLLSVYISVVYHSTTFEGFKLLALHVFGALLLLFLVVLTGQRLMQAFDFEQVIKERIMIPVGLLPKE